MAQQMKALKALNDTVDIPLEPDMNGAIGIEYGPFGDDGVTASTGTIVIEATISEKAWYALTIKKPDGSSAASLAAVALGYVETTGWSKVRARMSVAGGAQGVRVWANQKKG